MKLVWFKSAAIAGALAVLAGGMWFAAQEGARDPAGAAAVAGEPGARQPVEAQKVRWYVVHARDYKEYDDLLKTFVKRVSDRTKGALQIDISYSNVGSGWRDPQAEKNGHERILSGECDVSQLGVDTLGANVLLFPGLFRNYDHAEAVWRGEVGQELKQGIDQRSDGRLATLAFSYSGGYRALVGSRAIESTADVKGAKFFANANGHLSPDEELLALLGGVAVPEEAYEDYPVDRAHAAATVKRLSDALASGKMDLFPVEINGLAYAELGNPIAFKPLHVNLTDHSMYATSIVARKEFLNRLKPELRQAFVEETERFALEERQLSARLALANLEVFKNQYGHKVVPLPVQAKEAFAAASRAVRAKHPEWAGLIAKIEAAGEIPLLAGGPDNAGSADRTP